MDFKEIEFGSREFIDAIDLRNRILYLPIGHFLDINKQRADANEIFLAALDDGSVVGTLVLTPIDSNTVKMRQVAVEDQLQGRGIGAKLIRFAENIAADRGYSNITLDSRSSAVGFYLKAGYQTYGKEYLDENIKTPHRKMGKQIKT